MIKKKLDDFVVHESSSILETMEVIEKNQDRIAIVLDDREKFCGLLTDGNLRRALINGKELTSEIRPIVQRNPVVLNIDSNEMEARKLLDYRIIAIPVVDHQNNFVGIYTNIDKEESFNIRNRKIAVVGLGYVGLTLATVLADTGFQVWGFDINEGLIEKLKAKQVPFFEEGLIEYLEAHVGNNLKPISSLEGLRCDIYIIAVGTPLIRSSMEPNLNHIKNAMEMVGKNIIGGELIILRSTVPVGCSRKCVLPILEEKSKLKIGEDFYLSCAPERTIEGNAMEELRINPQIVGGYDRKSTKLTALLFNEFTQTIIDVESLEAAEMSKLLDNAYRDVNFSFSNQMIPVCEKLGLNLYKLIEAINMSYARNNLPAPSPGVGGACLSKDPYILKYVFEQCGFEAPVISVARQINEQGPKDLAVRIKNKLKSLNKRIEDTKIFMIGLAFKGDPETSDLRDSTSVWFLEHIRSFNVRELCAYDPVVEDQEILKLGVKPVSLEKGFENADVAVFLNNHKSYKRLKIHSLIKSMKKPALFVDCWDIFAEKSIFTQRDVVYVGLGKN